MWPFSPKSNNLKPQKPLQNFPVPAECVEELCELADAFNKSTSHADKYRLWTFCENNVPDFSEAAGIFTIQFDSARTASVQEVTL